MYVTNTVCSIVDLQRPCSRAEAQYPAGGGAILAGAGERAPSLVTGLQLARDAYLNPFGTKTLLRRFFMYCANNLGPYGICLNICIRLFEFSHMNFCICSFFEHYNWYNRLLTTCKLLKMYKIKFQRNNVIKIVTAIKNRLSSIFYAFTLKIRDLCCYSDVLPTPAHLKGPVLRL